MWKRDCELDTEALPIPSRIASNEGKKKGRGDAALFPKRAKSAGDGLFLSAHRHYASVPNACKITK
jgi:hypothetical protein